MTERNEGVRALRQVLAEVDEGRAEIAQLQTTILEIAAAVNIHPGCIPSRFFQHKTLGAAVISFLREQNLNAH